MSKESKKHKDQNSVFSGFATPRLMSRSPARKATITREEKKSTIRSSRKNDFNKQNSKYKRMKSHILFNEITASQQIDKIENCRKPIGDLIPNSKSIAFSMNKPFGFPLHFKEINLGGKPQTN